MARAEDRFSETRSSIRDFWLAELAFLVRDPDVVSALQEFRAKWTLPARREELEKAARERQEFRTAAALALGGDPPPVSDCRPDYERDIEALADRFEVSATRRAWFRELAIRGPNGDLPAVDVSTVASISHEETDEFGRRMVHVRVWADAPGGIEAVMPFVRKCLRAARGNRKGGPTKQHDELVALCAAFFADLKCDRPLPVKAWKRRLAEELRVRQGRAYSKGEIDYLDTAFIRPAIKEGRLPVRNRLRR